MLKPITEAKEGSSRQEKSHSDHSQSGHQSGGASGGDGSNPSSSKRSGEGNAGPSINSSSVNSGNDSSVFVGAWSREEELLLCFLFKKHGGDWQLVSKLLHQHERCAQVRSKEDVKLHFLRLIRKTLATYQLDEKYVQERRIRHMIRVIYEEQKEEFRKVTWDLQQKLSTIISDGLVKNWHLSPQEISSKARQLKAVLLEFKKANKHKKDSVASTSESNRNSMEGDMEPGYQSDFSSFFAEDEEGSSSREVQLRNKSCYSGSSEEGLNPYYERRPKHRKQARYEAMKDLLDQEGVLEYDQEVRRSTSPPKVEEAAQLVNSHESDKIPSRSLANPIDASGSNEHESLQESPRSE